MEEIIVSNAARPLEPHDSPLATFGAVNDREMTTKLLEKSVHSSKDELLNDRNSSMTNLDDATTTQSGNASKAVWISGPHIVHVYAMIFRLGDINTVQESFSVVLHLFMRWKPSQDDLKIWSTSPTGFTPTWKPTFVIANAVSVEAEPHEFENKSNFRIIKNGDANRYGIRQGFSNGDEWLVESSTAYKVTMTAHMNLAAFPFDSQELPVVFEMSETDEKAKFDTNILTSIDQNVTSTGTSSVVEFTTLTSHLSEWLIVPPLASIQSEWRFSKFYIRLKVVRMWYGYAFRVILPLVVLASISFAAFGFDVNDGRGDRISFLVTLLLTMTAFQFSIQVLLPQVSYLTAIDWFIQTCFIFLAIMLAESWLVSSQARDEQISNYFVIAWAVICGATLIMFTWFRIASLGAIVVPARNTSHQKRTWFEISGAQTISS
eukprot:gb/GEZN01008528.1/.p1 GENE.gb/GEZN01008528.1/~~gb/GEZN01008528.1/.p1  ORF type:complete len:433 (-),score=30.95 gb/GEZN01008528.1/:85-1383(-)